MKIFLIRHGQTEGDRKEVFVGVKGNYALTDMGKNQALKVNKILKRLTKDKNKLSVFSSPQKFVRQTAQIICDELKLKLKEDKSLSEIDFGSFNGLTKEQIIEKYPKEFKAFSESPSNCLIPKGETIPEVQNRVLSFLYDRLDEKNDLILVTHELVIRSVLVHMMNMSIDFVWSLSPNELAWGMQSKYEYDDAGNMGNAYVTVKTPKAKLFTPFIFSLIQRIFND